MTTPMQEFEKAFKGVSVYAIEHSGGVIGNVSFKTADSCRVFIDIGNAKMIIGRTRGTGYNRETAAVENAFMNAPFVTECPVFNEISLAVRGSLTGSGWAKAVKSAGYIVTQII